jgi:type IV secretory pathway component VirB8
MLKKIDPLQMQKDFNSIDENRIRKRTRRLAIVSIILVISITLLVLLIINMYW